MRPRHKQFKLSKNMCLNQNGSQGWCPERTPSRSAWNSHLGITNFASALRTSLSLISAGVDMFSTSTRPLSTPSTLLTYCAWRCPVNCLRTLISTRRVPITKRFWNWLSYSRLFLRETLPARKQNISESCRCVKLCWGRHMLWSLDSWNLLDKAAVGNSIVYVRIDIPRP